MGNNLCGHCDGKNSDKRNEWEISEETHVEISPEKVRVAEACQGYYKKTKAMAVLNENKLDMMRRFDDSLTEFGEYITQDKMNAQIDPNVLSIEGTIAPYSQVLSNETIDVKHTFTRPPIEFHDGTIYSGSWSYNGKKHGYGIFIKPDGSKYEGYWNDDRIHGKGRFIDKLGNYYEGDWKNGMADGKGSLVVLGGSRYDGNWVKDVQEGYGEEYFSDGTMYKGNYVNGLKHGTGRFTWKDGSYYEGEFFNSSITGNGVLNWKDGRVYSGNWLNNKMHGSGVFTWPDGKVYQGDYRNDKKEGKGAYYWSADKYYKGDWLNSKHHGEGMFFLNGKVLRGQFRFGKLIKRYDEEIVQNNENLSNNVQIHNGVSEIQSPNNKVFVDNESIGMSDSPAPQNFEVVEYENNLIRHDTEQHALSKINVGATSSPLTSSFK